MNWVNPFREVKVTKAPLPPQGKQELPGMLVPGRAPQTVPFCIPKGICLVQTQQLNKRCPTASLQGRSIPGNTRIGRGKVNQRPLLLTCGFTGMAVAIPARKTKPVLINSDSRRLELKIQPCQLGTWMLYSQGADPRAAAGFSVAPRPFLRLPRDVVGFAPARPRPARGA